MEFGAQMPRYPENIQLRQSGIMGFYIDGICGKDTLRLADPPPPGWNGASFKNYRMYDVETTDRSAERHTVSTFGGYAQLQSRYFASIHGDAHLKERNNAIHLLVNLQADLHTAFRLISRSKHGIVRRLITTKVAANGFVDYYV